MGVAETGSHPLQPSRHLDELEHVLAGVDLLLCKILRPDLCSLVELCQKSAKEAGGRWRLNSTPALTIALLGLWNCRAVILAAGCDRGRLYLATAVARRSAARIPHKRGRW